MLRRDTNAGFQKGGAWIFSRYRFVSGRIEAERTFSRGAYQRLRRIQAERPVLLMTDEERHRCWWVFRDAFYWEDEGYSGIEVKALVLQRQQLRDRRVQRAVALMENQSLPAEPRRAPVSQEVRLAVFQRDGGRCVSCGGSQDLQFDHIIPVALGGASTEANLQLLCADCNRAKGASLE